MTNRERHYLSASTGDWADPHTPEIHRILWDTVNKRAVRILLEFFLVKYLMEPKKIYLNHFNKIAVSIICVSVHQFNSTQTTIFDWIARTDSQSTFRILFLVLSVWCFTHRWDNEVCTALNTKEIKAVRITQQVGNIMSVNNARMHSYIKPVGFHYIKIKIKTCLL